jgi:hypothetical protein
MVQTTQLHAHLVLDGLVTTLNLRELFKLLMNDLVCTETKQIQKRLRVEKVAKQRTVSVIGPNVIEKLIFEGSEERPCFFNEEAVSAYGLGTLPGGVLLWRPVPVEGLVEKKVLVKHTLEEDGVHLKLARDTVNHGTRVEEKERRPVQFLK